MEPSERRDHVTRHLTEVVTEGELETLLSERDRPTAYIGYAPTGEMHIGHLTTIRKLVDFHDAGIDVTVLIADVHAHLDDEKSPWELLEPRSEYYERGIRAMIDSMGGDVNQTTFVRGSSFELEAPYTMELYRLTADTTIGRAQRAGSEVVRQREDPKLGGLLYTLMQALDVAALDVDIAYGGIDQRGIYMLAREMLPNLGHEKPICLFAPLLSGLEGQKMSASEAGSTITITDSSTDITEKINGAYCPAGQVENNGVLEYLEYLVFPTFVNEDSPFVIERPEKFGGNVDYSSYDALETDYIEGELHPQDLKGAVGGAIAEIVNPIREQLDDPDLMAAAYPDTYA